jgi:Methane/Phenol/Toluene Hydroxylase
LSFADPRRTTYRVYTEDWIEFLDRCYAPLRFPAHGLQMLAAYIAQMAPTSRVTNRAAFQAADEIRRLQRIAYRTAQLAEHRSAIDLDTHRRHWEEAEAYQPLRELIERALIAYDWAEALFVTTRFSRSSPHEVFPFRTMTHDGLARGLGGGNAGTLRHYFGGRPCRGRIGGMGGSPVLRGPDQSAGTTSRAAASE